MQGTTVTADYGASAEKLSGTVSWMLQDGQGSTRRLLNSSQSVVASYVSDAFGNSVGGSGTSTNPFIWNGGSGYYADAESGLQKVGARYYDPAVGRWISQDTELVAGSPADSQALNRYSYCESNPICGTDPSGHDEYQDGLDGLWAGEKALDRAKYLLSEHSISQEFFGEMVRDAEVEEQLGRSIMADAHEKAEEERFQRKSELTAKSVEAVSEALDEAAQFANERDSQAREAAQAESDEHGGD